MTKLKIIILITAFILLQYGCITTKSYINFEVLEPATITYPENAQTIGYLNRSPRTFDSFANINIKSLNDTDLYIVDTVICKSHMKGFLEGKSSSAVSYLDKLLYLEARRSDTVNRSLNVSSKKVDEICESFELDVLITQDYYTVELDEDMSINSEGQYEKYYMLIHDVKWTINTSGQTKALDVFIYHDTLYFVNNGSWRNPKYITSIEMLKICAHEAGYVFGKRNIPVWNEVSRLVYIGGDKELRLARSHTNKGDWESAHHIWSQNLASEDVKLVAKSAHNIAVYYELEDEIEQALAFSKKANELWPSPGIELYKQELEIRLLNKNDLYKQFGVGKQ